MTSFSDSDVKAVVSAGQLSNPAASSELVRILADRRDKIGRYWFGRANPLDRFWMDGDRLHFDDLAVKAGLANPHETNYEYTVVDAKGGPPLLSDRIEAGEPVPIPSISRWMPR